MLCSVKIFMANVLFFRVILGDKNAVTAEALVIQPVNLAVNIVRNLSAAWFHKHPDVEIAGMLDAFAVSFKIRPCNIFMVVLCWLWSSTWPTLGVNWYPK